MNIDKIIGFLRSLLIPEVCLSCGNACANGKGLCNDCRAQFEREAKEICPECGCTASDCECGIGFSAHTSAIGGKKFIALTFYKSSRNYPDSDRLTEKMIFALKANGRWSDYFAEELASKIKKLAEDSGEDIRSWRVVYIPRTAEKKKIQGIDQGEEISRRLAHLLGIPFDDIFGRIHGSEQKTLGKSERSENMEKSLYVHKRPREKGKYILFDDIITSGASVETAARLLRFEGAEDVFPVVIARTMKPESSVRSERVIEKSSKPDLT